MNQKATKVTLTVLVLVAAFGALLYTSLSDNLQYYKFVDEVLAAPQSWEGKPMRVHGYVVPNTIGKKSATREYRFQVQRNRKTLQAYFTGTPPDAFKDDAEVILTGTLKGDRFDATAIEAKCPSKYEEAGTKTPTVTLPGVSS